MPTPTTSTWQPSPTRASRDQWNGRAQVGRLHRTASSRRPASSPRHQHDLAHASSQAATWTPAHPTAPPRARRRGRSEEGSSSLELAILMPVLLLAVFSIFQGAFYYHARGVALAAAQDGLRSARAENGTAAAGGRSAQAFLDQAGKTLLTGSRVTPSRTATTARVTVTGRAKSVIPGVQGKTISQTATGPVERFTTP